jgi:putative ABC transport system permease protein
MPLLIRSIWRSLIASPFISLAAVLSLALGIGANTAIFSIVNSLLIRPLPVRDPDRLVLVTYGTGGRGALTHPIWEEVRRRQELFGGAAAWASEQFNLAAHGRSDFVDGLFVSGGFLDTMGLRPILGRGISAMDDAPSGSPDGPVIMLGYDFWRRRFGGDPGVVGRSLTIGRHPMTIVGVAPPGFFGLDVGSTFDIAVPFAVEPLLHNRFPQLSARTSWWVNILLRRKDGQSLTEAVATLRAIQPGVREATIPQTYSPQDAADYLTVPFELQPVERGVSRLRERYQRPLMTIMVVVLLVLLIGCANIANLLLARAASRRHELSVRRALGASSLQLGVQLLFESLVLAAGGALLGLGLAVWGGRLLVRQLSATNRTALLDLTLDWRVLAFTAAVTVFTAIIFGMAPAIGAARVQPSEALKKQGRGVFGERRFSPSHLLVIGQVTLSLVLVFAAGLFIRTFQTLTTQPIGFTRDRVLVVRIDNLTDAPTQVAMGLYERLRQAAAAVPGVEVASASAMTPVNGILWQFLLELPDGPALPEPDRTVAANLTMPGYFATFGTRLLAGRDFLASDTRSSQPVAIVNQAFARKYFDGKSLLGRRIRQAGFGGRPSIDREIVGIVEDAVYQTLRQADAATVYLPLAQRPQPPASINISVRSAFGSPEPLTNAVFAALSRVAPDAMLTARSVSDQLQGSVAQDRLVAMLSGLFGVLAVVLAGVGLYGVTSSAVARRRTEIGIRMALGARPGNVIRLILTSVAAQVGLGIVFGTLISLWASRFVATLLYGLHPRDPLALGAGALVLATIGALAGWLPARRAAKIDPAVALRES